MKPENQAGFDRIVETLEGHRDIYNEMSRFALSKKSYDKKTIHDNNYHKCRKMFPKVPSQVVIRAKDAVAAAYRALKKQSRLHDLKEPCEAKGLAMRLDKRLYSWNGDRTVALTAMGGGRVRCTFDTYPKFDEMDGLYESGDPTLFVRDGSPWLAVPFNVPEPTLSNDGGILGVDLGLRRTVTTSEGVVFHDKKFLGRKRRLRYDRRQLQGRRSSSAKRKLRRLKRRERNINRKYCEWVANRILDTDCDTVVMEDLSSLKKNKLGRRSGNSRTSRNRLSQAPFYTFLHIMSYKAPLAGKRVVTVDPAYTSQDDHRGVPRGERKGCRYYACDGLVFDADWQAAITIALRHASTHDRHHPVSFSLPIDGRLNLTGRPPSTGRSCHGPQVRRCKPMALAVGS